MVARNSFDCLQRSKKEKNIIFCAIKLLVACGPNPKHEIVEKTSKYKQEMEKKLCRRQKKWRKHRNVPKCYTTLVSLAWSRRVLTEITYNRQVAFFVELCISMWQQPEKDMSILQIPAIPPSLRNVPNSHKFTRHDRQAEKAVLHEHFT